MSITQGSSFPGVGLATQHSFNFKLQLLHVLAHAVCGLRDNSLSNANMSTVCIIAVSKVLVMTIQKAQAYWLQCQYAGIQSYTYDNRI